MSVEPFKIFIGWDSREDIAYQVAKQTILDTATIPVDIQPLKQKDLRKAGLYTREVDKLASTEFTFTRFLLPELCNFKGWALFIDCDFVFKNDIKELFDQRKEQYAIMCAQHDYTPKEGSIKMDGQVQQQYPRKNWSSMMLVNCGHPSNSVVTKDFVNDERKTGAYLHRFSWLLDKQIGEISHEWNWLVGWYKEPEDGTPKALHYTEGGPWFKEYRNCEYALEWFQGKSSYLESELEESKKKLETNKNKTVKIEDMSYPKEMNEYFYNKIKSWIDPTEHYFKTKEEIKKYEEVKSMGIKVAGIAPQKGDFNLEKKGLEYDPYISSFIIGAGGYISDFDREKGTDNTLVIRGLGGGGQKALNYCVKEGRDFYAIDTGYYQPGTKKEYHRITKNGLQQQGPIIARPHDRLSRLRWKPRKYREGEYVLVCPPSEKVMKYYGEDLDKWMKKTVSQIKQHTDRKIIVRQKPDRRLRVTTDTIWAALNDAYCLVTYNSIAATEALLWGKPAIALAPNAATVLCNSRISEINKLNIPEPDQLIAYAAHLSYCQFTEKEMRDGTAWAILNES